jgi:serine/threonine-protein phosphatase 4 regulatory subunit 1
MSLNMQTIFVSEVDRVGHDPVYWVRREASFAVGALAKVVPLELVLSSLVGRQILPVLASLTLS